MSKQIEALQKRIEELEAEVRKLKANKANQYHYHFHQNPVSIPVYQPLPQPYIYPNLPPNYPIVTCGGTGISASLNTQFSNASPV